MDELNDLLRGLTEGMKGGTDPKERDAGNQQLPLGAGARPGRDRPAPPNLPSRSERQGDSQVSLCPECGGAGFLIYDLPLGHPEYGKPVPCRCKMDERRTRRRRHFKDVHNLDALARFTFDTFNTNLSWLPAHKLQSLERAFSAAYAFAMQPEGWLLFTGTYGCGKTHLAAAIANHRIESDQSAIFVVVPDLLDHLRSTFGPSSEASYDDLFDEVRNTQLLLLDDLGVQGVTPWAQEKMFQILNHRYNRQLPTVLTTNQRLSDLDQRLRSRLHDLNLVEHIHIRAPDYRAGADPVHGDLSTLSLYSFQRFETFEVQRRNSSPAESANLREVKQSAMSFAEDPQGWLVLIGASGSGKTHLAAAISNELRASGQDDIMFVVVPDLLDYLRAAFNPDSTDSHQRRFDELKRVPLLVLDNLGTESATPWAKEKLFQLLNYRHSALLPTVITTTIAEKRLDPWLRTRIGDENVCQVLTIGAVNNRSGAGPSTTLQPQQEQRTSRRTYSG